MTKEIISLPQTQLAYARAIRMIEMYLDDGGCAAEGGNSEACRRVVNQLERLGNLTWKDMPNWRYRVRLDELYEFSDKENNLLLDLYDAGGKYESRTYDDRFANLGGGAGVAKGAVTLSAQQKWYVNLTDRGREYIERVLLKNNERQAQ